MVKISAAANPNVGGGGGGIVGKLKASGNISTGKTNIGGQPSGKPKSFLAMLAGEGASGGVPSGAGGGGGGGKKQTGKKGE